MAGTENLFSRAVEISEEYLGPAGERFIRRQISTHIGIEPEHLTAKHVPQLVEWIKLAFAMLTDNEKEVHAFTQSLLSLTETKKGR